MNRVHEENEDDGDYSFGVDMWGAALTVYEILRVASGMHLSVRETLFKGATCSAHSNPNCNRQSQLGAIMEAIGSEGM